MSELAGGIARHETFAIGTVGPWSDPSAGMQKGAETPQSSASMSKPDLEWPWDPQSRCYLAEMHDTEVRLL